MLKNLIFILVIFVSGVNAATFTVTKTTDSNDGLCDSDCSFREAVGAANAVASDDIIRFSIPNGQCPDLICTVRVPPDGHVTVTNNGGLTIQGNSWFRTILSITGGNSIILVNSGNTNLVVNDLRITGGNYPASGVAGGGFHNTGTAVMNRVWIDHNSAYTAHGIYNNGTLTLNDCNVYANGRNTGSGAGIYNGAGSTLNLNKTSIVGNFASSSIGGGDGGGIINGGTVNAQNSTIVENYGWFAGGGISNYGYVNLQNVTVVGNSSSGPSGIYNYYGGFQTSQTRNALIASNIEWVGLPFYDFGPDSYIRPGQSFVNSFGNNIIGNCSNSAATACGYTNGVNNDSAGTTASPILPKLSPFGLYGGNSFSQVPLTTSPVLDGGNNCVTDLSCPGFNPSTALTTDQRGATRSGNVDVGAVENNPGFVAGLPTAYLDVPYTLTLVPNSGTFTYNVISGSIPTGMSFTNSFAEFAENTKNFVPQASVTLSGTPTVGGVYNFTVRISDGTNTADVNYSILVSSPTAAGVSLSGRVLNSNGRGIYGARMSLTDSSGTVRYVTTNPLGYYRFTDVAAGETYILSATGKRLRLTRPSRVLNVTEDLTDIDFITY